MMAVLTHATVKVQEGFADVLYLDDRLVGKFASRPVSEVFKAVADVFNTGQITVMLQMEAELTASFARIPSSLNLLRMGIPQPE